jgi:hypothetical protein
MKRISILLVSLILICSLFAQSSIDLFLKADSLISAEKREEAEEYLIQLINENPYAT